MRIALSFGALALALALLACSSGASTSNGTTGASGGSTAALDGTWDITQAGGDTIGASQMTISNGTISGYIAASDEGQVDPSSKCTISKDRSTFTITVQGNALTMTVGNDFEYTGTSCPPTGSGTPGTLTGTRTMPAADSDTQLNGSWTLTRNDGSTFAAFSIAGLGGKAWSTPVNLSGPPVLTVAIANGAAVVSTTEQSLSFAAQKR